MINEEAFEKWANPDNVQALKTDSGIYINHDMQIAFTAWQAAIAYMQEQNKSAEQSEPVGELDDELNMRWINSYGVRAGDKLYTTPQRVEASDKTSLSGVVTRQMKRLSNEKLCKLYASSYTVYDFANAIMDEMERINK